MDETEYWFTIKHDEIKTLISSQDVADKLCDCKSNVKVIESLETKIDTISSDLESSEYEELKQKLTLLIEEEKKLAVFAKSTLKTLVESSYYQKRFVMTLGEFKIG